VLGEGGADACQAVAMACAQRQVESIGYHAALLLSVWAASRIGASMAQPIEGGI
jgi:hypothetical protein